MKNRFKKILVVIIVVFVLGILMYNISFLNQEIILEEYTFNFNSKRKELGLKRVSKNWVLEKKTWNNWNELANENYDDGNILKFLKVFSMRNISTGMIFKNESTDENSIFQTKIVWINSNILFWKNGIESEVDMYENTIDSVTTENLSIRYYFKDDNGNKNYFEADYFQMNQNDIGFCGMPSSMEREEQRSSGKPYCGNITKKQADSILTKWKSKN